MAAVAVTTSRRVPVAMLTALLALTWLVIGPRTPDLAAAVYRAGLFANHGLQVYDGAWYGGHHLLGYSMVFPALAAALGTRVTGVASAIVSAILFERLAVGHWGTRARPAVACFAIATAGDLLIGRLTFNLGIAIGLGALLALVHGRPWLAAALGVTCSITSPVAGVFLALATATFWLADRRRRRTALGLCATTLAAVLVLQTAFPEGGVEPDPVASVVAIVGFSALVAALVDPREREIRIGARLYALAGALVFAIPTPMGGNMSRLGAEFAAPLLVGGLAARPAFDRRRRVLLALTLVGVCAWALLAPVREVAKGVDDPSTGAAYYQPLIGFLTHATSGPVRIEVPFTRAHWEAVHLARRFPLARGWETQLDVKYNSLFYKSGGVTTDRYHRWLLREAVSYVALPDAPLDKTSRAEARLIRSGPAYLRPVWHSSHWQVFRVLKPQPLVTGPARLTLLAPDHFQLAVRRAAPVLVRVRYTPYWTVAAGGCVARAPSGWTQVTATHPGTVDVSASFSLSAVVDGGRTCSPDATTG